MNGSGCRTCPVKNCRTTQYRGSECAAQRAALNCGDPETNEDYITSLRGEALVDWIDSFNFCGQICNNDHAACTPDTCKRKIREWLQMPAGRTMHSKTL